MEADKNAKQLVEDLEAEAEIARLIEKPKRKTSKIDSIPADVKAILPTIPAKPKRAKNCAGILMPTKQVFDQQMKKWREKYGKYEKYYDIYVASKK